MGLTGRRGRETLQRGAHPGNGREAPACRVRETMRSLCHIAADPPLARSFFAA
jgi:hypothetical protein